MKGLRWTGITIAGLAALLASSLALSIFKKWLAQNAGRLKPAATTVAPSGTLAPDLSIYRTDPKWIWWNEQVERDPNFEWKMPINFYGRVVDQDGQPVQGVEIVFQWTDLSMAGTSQKTVFTAGDGAFNLTGVHGKRLVITWIHKEGYYSANQGVETSFEYAAFFESNYHRPDRTKPVVFRLRKKGEIPKDLRVRETMMGLMPNGEPKFIELATTYNSSPERADLALRITRGASTADHKYDWEANIEGVNGTGMIESDDEFMFEAPEGGYEKAYSYRFRAADPEWENRTGRKYFVRAKDGLLFGWVEITFIPKYRDGAAIDVRFYINPTGSRALEYNPNEILPR